VRRYPTRGVYDRKAIEAILDEGLVCHVGFVHDGAPVVIPTLYARVGDRVYLHGSAASRMLRTLSGGCEICLTVTLVDGLVLARSAFHHSANYRSVAVFGRAYPVSESDAKLVALEAFSEHLVPGRWTDVRPPNERELKATMVLALALDESSAKIRTGPPVDDEADYNSDTWAGIIPLCLRASEALADERVQPDLAVPAYVANYERGAAEQ